LACAASAHTSAIVQSTAGKFGLAGAGIGSAKNQLAFWTVVFIEHLQAGFIVILIAPARLASLPKDLHMKRDRRRTGATPPATILYSDVARSLRPVAGDRRSSSSLSTIPHL